MTWLTSLRSLVGTLAASLFCLSGVLAAQDSGSPVNQNTAASDKSGSKLYELRFYVTHPGKLPALHARFRDHTMRLFEKHGSSTGAIR